MSRFYERRKYALTLAALPRAHYRRAFEPGCANGALSELLAERCDELFCCDLVEATVERARQRLRPFAHVRSIGRRVALISSCGVRSSTISRKPA